jgi:adenylate cyclase
MALEIERKFLVNSDAWRNQATRSEEYRQGYLNDLNTCSVRVRIAGERAYLNIKSARLGIMRHEYEYVIPLADGREMLRDLCIGSIVEKTRYFVPFAGHIWEVDVFSGDNAGLVVAEIELDAADARFDLPSWVGQEVSDDPRYYNVNLVSRPFKDW